MEEKGFLSALFDLSFSSMITVKIIRFLYVIALIGAAIWTLIILAALFDASSEAGVVGLILSPVIFLLFAIVVRVYLEMTVVLFKIADNTAVVAESTRQEQQAPATPPTTQQSGAA